MHYLPRTDMILHQARCFKTTKFIFFLQGRRNIFISRHCSVNINLVVDVRLKRSRLIKFTALTLCGDVITIIMGTDAASKDFLRRARWPP